jgi:hypothetical protein
MTLPDLIDAAPDYLQESASEVAWSIGIAAAALRDDLYAYVALILNRNDDMLAAAEEEDGETEEDDA